jgi:hypothetical protein
MILQLSDKTQETEKKITLCEARIGSVYQQQCKCPTAVQVSNSSASVQRQCKCPTAVQVSNRMVTNSATKSEDIVQLTSGLKTNLKSTHQNAFSS